MWSRKWAILSLGPPAALVVGIVAFAITDLALYSPRPFDAKRWREGDARERNRMVGDLNHSQVLIGKTRDEVVTLLGPANREEARLLLEYELLHSDVFGFWELRELLCLRFDNTGRVGDVSFFD